MSDLNQAIGQAAGVVFAIVVNGEERNAKSGDTVADLLRALGLENGRVAIERNFEILPRAEWADTKIAAGDRYEIVQFVGGG
jgi:thiamine biosynthesis protein ThiS